MSEQQRAPDVGDRAPDFRLRHTFDIEVGLAEVLERGPALVVFYVFDFGGY
jgi:peroxiredoxin